MIEIQKYKCIYCNTCLNILEGKTFNYVMCKCGKTRNVSDQSFAIDVSEYFSSKPLIYTILYNMKFNSMSLVNKYERLFEIKCDIFNKSKDELFKIIKININLI